MRLLILALLLASCASRKATYSSEDLALIETVKLGTSVPNGELLGDISASSGRGCGSFGTRSDPDQTYRKLKLMAAKRGGNYVVIGQIKNPELRLDGCFDNRHTVNGLVYKVSN